MRNAPLETLLSMCVRASGMRGPIATCCAEGKREPGMNHDELRFWHGWHHHMPPWSCSFIISWFGGLSA